MWHGRLRSRTAYEEVYSEGRSVHARWHGRCVSDGSGQSTQGTHRVLRQDLNLAIEARVMQRAVVLASWRKFLDASLSTAENPDPGGRRFVRANRRTLGAIIL